MSDIRDAGASFTHFNISHRALLGAGAAIGASMMLPAAAHAQASEPVSGGTLRIAMPFNPAALDPITGRNIPDFNALYALFDALVGYDPDTLELEPTLAKGWTF